MKPRASHQDVEEKKKRTRYTPVTACVSSNNIARQAVRNENESTNERVDGV
jgi:hypothetical protein